MRKIFAILTVFALALVLVSCGQDTSTVDMFLSPNKIVYSIDETTGGLPNISNGDFELYRISANHAASKVEDFTVSSTTIDPLGDNIFKITASYGLYTLSYNVYVYDETAADADAIAVAALSTSVGITSESEKLSNVMKLYWTTIANQVDLEGISVILATFGAQNQSEASIEPAIDHLTTPENYETNVMKMSSLNNLTFNFDDANATTILVKNHTVKPADNQLPISIEMENNWLGYVWDWLLIIPISTVMHFFASLFFNSFAVGILFATIIVRTLAWPIYARANDMSMKMALAQPEMAKLQNKYAMKKDPASQQKMQMEMMGIYKRHGISILGCFTPLLQMPLFLAMFQVVYRITNRGGMYVDSISNTTLFGSLDLTVGGFEDPWSYVLAIIVGSTMFLLQKISARKPSYAKNTGTQVKTEQALQTERTMKTVTTVMIAMMVLTTLTSVNALGFYWVIGNLYSLGQSLINRKLSERKYQKQKAAQTIV